MHNLIVNFLIILLPFATWFLIGFGPSLALLPHSKKHTAFLLAPLVGMCLLTLISLFEITVLLTPLVPWFNIGILIVISSIIYLRLPTRAATKKHRQCFRQYAIYLCPSLLLLVLIFSWLFHNDGIHMLVGGSDQLQYAQNARHIAEQMHTGSLYDSPIARLDYFISEFCTRYLVYLKDYRRGAEVLLATTSIISGLSFEEAFPVTILCGLLTLSLTLGFLGRGFFSLSLPTTCLFQLTFLSSFYFWVLHIQGSLALTMSIASGLLALAMLTRTTTTLTGRNVLLTAILVAAYLSIYKEPSLVSLFVPSFLLIFIQTCKSWSNGFNTFKRIIMVYLLVFILAPPAIYTAIMNTFGNMSTVLQQFATVTGGHHESSLFMSSWIKSWDLSAVILGIMSYYDVSAVNNHITLANINHPWIGFLCFLILWTCAFLGYFKHKNYITYLFASILAMWILASLILVSQHDTLRFARSLHYGFPFTIFGLMLLVAPWRHAFLNKNNLYWTAASWSGRIILTAFLLINLHTNIGTLRYLTAHNVSNDKILLRFNERAPTWQLLHQELNISALHKSPVLISGFKDTIHATAFASLIRAQPQVLGDSILSFWHIDRFNIPRSRALFNTLLTQDTYKEAQKNEQKTWSAYMPYLISQSEQALVPVGHSFPIEWENSKDIYPSHRVRFTNICDVIYKNRFAVTLTDNMTSSLSRDQKGPFRTLLKSGEIIIQDASHATQWLTITYEGKVDDLSIRAGNISYIGKKLNDSQNVVSILINTNINKDKPLQLIMNHKTKLRSIHLSS